MKRLLVSLFLAGYASLCHAQGWLDYTLDIGDGYAIWRNNSMDINVANSNNTILIGPGASDAVGPIVAYSTTEKFIFTRNAGKKPRNLFKGDTFQNIDPDREFFFVLTKGTDEVAGPFTKQEFENRPETKAGTQIQWLKPKNPNFWLPLLGSLMFLAIAIPLLAIKYFWITIPVILAIALLIKRILNKRKQKAQPAH